MPNLPISGLPVTATPLATDELANEQSLVTKKITLQQVSDFVQSDTSFNEHEVLYGNNTGGINQSASFTFDDTTVSLGLGPLNVLTGSNSVILGGNTNQVDGDNSVISGSFNCGIPVAGSESGIIGSSNSQVTGNNSAIIGSENSSLSGDLSIIAAISNSTVSGNKSVACGGSSIALFSNNSFVSGINVTVDALAQSAVVFGTNIALTTTAINTFTWSDSPGSLFTVTEPGSFNVHANGFVYFETPEIRTTADRIHFNKEVISASYTPEITGLVVADGPIQIGAPLKQSPTTDFRVMQISSGDSSATGIIGFAVTAAAIAGDIIEISDFKIVTCQLSPTEACFPGEATRKSSTAGRILARTTLTSTGTFGSTAQTGVANDFIKVWIIHNEVAGLTAGSRREIRIQEYDDGGEASSGVSRPYPGITVFVVSPGVDDRTGLTGIILPADFDPTTDVDIEINWAPTTAAAGNVVWQVNYSFLPLNGTIALNSNLATINTTESASTNAEFPGKSTVTLNTGSALPGDQLFIHVTRMGSDVLDTYPDDVWITSISPFYISTIL